MIAIDNSEWSRNGDLNPTRLMSQQDAATLVCDVKTQQNMESTVGIMSSGGAKPEIRVTQTRDHHRISVAIQAIKVGGVSNIVDTIKIAALSLKHRSNKSQKPRVIVFNGSPILEEEKTLVTLGKKLRKNKVALDVVNFGHPENAPLIQALVNAVNNSENSHFIDVPTHVQFLSDGLMGSPVMVDSDVPMGDGGAADPGAGMAMPGGIDPNVDPELAQAI